MADAVHFDVEGLNGLLKSLHELAGEKASRTPVRRALQYGAELVRHTARSLAPIRQKPYPFSRHKRIPGTLFANIKTHKLRSRRGRIGYIVTSALPGTWMNTGDAFYGSFLEYGTPLAAPRPFMRPAIDQNREGIIARTSFELDKAITRIVKRNARLAAKAAA